MNLWLNRDPGRLPALLHPPRGQGWWWTPAGAAWTDGARLWVERGARVLCVPLPGEVSLVARGEALLAWNGWGGWVRLEGDRAWTGEDPRNRTGLDLQAVRRVTWAVQTRAAQPLPLPEGAREAAELRPSPTGHALAWRWERALYRRVGDRTQALGSLPAGGRFEVGPEGAVLLGHDGRWEAGAAPRGPLRPLPRPLRWDGWGVRWSDDGETVAGVDLEGLAVRTALRGRTERLGPGLLPLDTEGTVLDPEGTVRRGSEILRRGIREASLALEADALHGPGGLSWDLATLRPRFQEPRLQLGATVPAPRGLATVGFEDGEGWWVAPHTGALIGRFSVPVNPEDPIVGAAWHEDALWVLSAEGRGFRVGDGEARPAHDPPRPTHLPRKGEGFRITREGLRVGEVLWPLQVEGAVRVGAQVVAFSADGLLVALPAAGP